MFETEIDVLADKMVAEFIKLGYKSWEQTNNDIRISLSHIKTKEKDTNES